MTGYEAIQIITRALKGGELVVSANGFITRELFAIRDSAANFYMLGSMGQASSIGLGLALSLPDRKVVVIDGDGNILMNLASLATIGHHRPKNLLHFVLDNGIYASTGGQSTVSDTVKIEEIARASGYAHSVKTNSAEELDRASRHFLSLDGPSLALVKIEKGNRELPRVSIAPPDIKDRFMQQIEEWEESV
jgi:sulfopyruvate decarboxylase beta subunit